MATAPKPGVGARNEATEAARQVLKLRIKDRTWHLATNSLPLDEKMAVRKATGMPIEAFVSDEDRLGEDSLVVLWWLARRANGERKLSFRAVTEEWAALDLGEDDIDVDVVDPDERPNDPEA